MKMMRTPKYYILVHNHGIRIISTSQFLLCSPVIVNHCDHTNKSRFVCSGFVEEHHRRGIIVYSRIRMAWHTAHSTTAPKGRVDEHSSRKYERLYRTKWSSSCSWSIEVLEAESIQHHVCCVSGDWKTLQNWFSHDVNTNIMQSLDTNNRDVVCTCTRN